MLRLAKIKDIPNILTITKLAVYQMQYVDKFNQWDETYPNEKVFTNDINSNTLYVLEIDDNIVGFICINKQLYDAYNQVTTWNDSFDKAITLHRICIDPTLQQKGLGRLLITQAEEIVIEAGYNYIIVDTYSHNIRMNKLLLNLKFNFLGQMDLKPNRAKWNCYDKKLNHTLYKK